MEELKAYAPNTRAMRRFLTSLTTLAVVVSLVHPASASSASSTILSGQGAVFGQVALLDSTNGSAGYLSFVVISSGAVAGLASTNVLGAGGGEQMGPWFEGHISLGLDAASFSEPLDATDISVSAAGAHLLAPLGRFGTADISLATKGVGDLPADCPGVSSDDESGSWSATALLVQPRVVEVVGGTVGAYRATNSYFPLLFSSDAMVARVDETDLPQPPVGVGGCIALLA